MTKDFLDGKVEKKAKPKKEITLPKYKKTSKQMMIESKETKIMIGGQLISIEEQQKASAERKK